ncbi:hypothetical protein EB796_025069 [Bugula neritina]|uniref:Uncharacterized protein n=1 Tax=Bugula neritina TaxID=10212 RepID=A0A7J7IRV2_BUGNE|nr:hypothetical protein EB796_025069 [Bugula neritina]
MLQYGLLPKSHKRGRVFVEESAQITFDSPKEQYLVCHLDTEQETDFDLEQCVIDSYNSEDKGRDRSECVAAPDWSIQARHISGARKQEGEKVYLVSYLLECIKPFSQRLVFQNYGDKLGVQSMKKVLQEATRTKSLHKLRAAVALMKTNKLVDKVAEEAALAEDMLQKMEQIDEMNKL